ncbi:Peptidoglycan/xylan/chitin deacetylase, PgdA/CDA1 family [Micromonospora pattaloongensis]|uniref:Peptidoglycan/xylan/chitin deacetylase, PgdA/CDA1 family n=1 Tax=Micromonospora pattaloongensis TaxID=405436 RepID=A0A1H3LTF8_9ACTN|nr:polysaccharide deacetylase family protein [Micromonospora pattaloongensis]SDY67369.1 Peptidoglycan/xylan/chitin deacetylase, PgdA/CDA1 family [Micromonospora pattaloongensis]
MGDERARATRRTFLRRGGLLMAGAGLGAAGFAEAADVTDRKLPIRAGAAGATRLQPSRPGRGELLVTWAVETDRKLVALTFDDGPRPEWTTLVLDTLERHRAPATFFMVGQRAQRHAPVVRGRMNGHEVGNHTWAHRDLARTDPAEARTELRRAHDAIQEATGQGPSLLRPPYGHLGGGAVLAAAELGYHLVFWSQQMLEKHFHDDPGAQAREVVAKTQPGTILLAHDVGKPERLVGIRALPELIEGLRGRGYEFVTVSELMRARRGPPGSTE